MKNRKGKDLPGILISFGGALVLFLALLLGLGWGLAGSMVPSVLLYGALTLLVRPGERIGKIKVSSLENGELLHERLGEAGADYERMKTAAGAIQDTELKNSCLDLLDIAEKILNFLTENPEKIMSARRYIDYYQETGASVLEQYVQIQDTRIGEKEQDKLLENTKEAVETLKTAFQIQFQKLVQNELLDMEADLKLLKQNLGAEGCRLPGKDEGGK